MVKTNTNLPHLDVSQNEYYKKAKENQLEIGRNNEVKWLKALSNSKWNFCGSGHERCKQ